MGELENRIEKVATLLADRVADKVVDVLMKASFDKQFANSLLAAFKAAVEEQGRG